MKKEEKMRKEVSWFVHKYIWKKENLNLFVNQLCPVDCAEIVKKMFERGLTFTWNEEDLPEEIAKQKETRTR